MPEKKRQGGRIKPLRGKMLLQENVRGLRGELGHRVARQLRIVPDIDFLLDTSLDYAAHIDELLRK